MSEKQTSGVYHIAKWQKVTLPVKKVKCHSLMWVIYIMQAGSMFCLSTWDLADYRHVSVPFQYLLQLRPYRAKTSEYVAGSWTGPRPRGLQPLGTLVLRLLCFQTSCIYMVLEVRSLQGILPTLFVYSIVVTLLWEKKNSSISFNFTNK